MVIDDVLVFRAEVKGLRTLAKLPRPKVRITSEELPGALCLWEPHDPSDAEAGVDADFFHAPGTMTYLAVSENGSAVSTGSISSSMA